MITSSYTESLKPPHPWGPHAPNSLTLMRSSALYSLPHNSLFHSINTFEGGGEAQSKAQRREAKLAGHSLSTCQSLLMPISGFTGGTHYSLPQFSSSACMESGKIMAEQDCSIPKMSGQCHSILPKLFGEGGIKACGLL